MYKKIAIIFNPTKSKKKLQKFVNLIQKKNIDIEIDIFTTSSSEDVSKKTKDAVAQKPDLIVCAGGDGTLYGVVNGFSHYNVPVLLLPLGTSNDLAKQLDIYSIVDSASAVENNNIEQMDLGECSFFNQEGEKQKKYFTSAAGTGLFANLFYIETNKVIIFLRKFLSELAFVPVVFWHLVIKREKNRHEITLNDTRLSYNSLAFFEISKLKVIGGFNLTYLAEYNNRLLDVLIVESGSIWSDLKLFFYAFFSRTKFHRSSQIHYFSKKNNESQLPASSCVKTVELNTEKKAFLHLNGDWVGYTPAKFTIAPTKLKVLTMKKQS